MRIILLILLLINSLIAESRILFPTMAIHEKEKDVNGYLLNENNYGVGFQKKYDNQSATAMVLNDSYNSNMFILAYGYDIEPYSWLEIGSRVGIGYKNLAIYENKELKGYEYNIVPIVSFPITLKYEIFSITASYTPSVSMGDYDGVGFTLILIGVEI